MLPLTTLASSPPPQDLGEKDLSSRSSLSQNKTPPPHREGTPCAYGDSKDSISQDQHHARYDRLHPCVMLRVVQFESDWAGRQGIRLLAAWLTTSSNSSLQKQGHPTAP